MIAGVLYKISLTLMEISSVQAIISLLMANGLAIFTEQQEVSQLPG